MGTLEREADIHTEREAGREGGRERGEEGRERDKQTDRQTDRQRQRETPSPFTSFSLYKVTNGICKRIG